MKYIFLFYFIFNAVIQQPLWGCEQQSEEEMVVNIILSIEEPIGSQKRFADKCKQAVNNFFRKKEREYITNAKRLKYQSWPSEKTSKIERNNRYIYNRHYQPFEIPSSPEKDLSLPSIDN